MRARRIPTSPRPIAPYAPERTGTPVNITRRRRATIITLTLLTMLAGGCATDDMGAAQDAAEEASTPAPQESAATPAAPASAPPVAAQEPSSEPAVAQAPASDPPSGQDAGDGLTASAAIDALRYANLPVGEVRDQTAATCTGDVACVAHLTTDYVDVYEWPSAQQAEQNLTVGAGRETVQLERVVLQFGVGAQRWPVDTAPYERVAREALRRAQ